MKKFAVLFIVFALALAPIVSAQADTDKTVDGSGERWEQESSDVSSLATMTWNREEDTLCFSGTGYKDRAGMKFGFRSKIAYDATDLSVTLQFPETFNAVYSESNNMHFVFALVNTWSRWWNTDGNDVKSAAFIIRPQSQDIISVELAGRWGLGAAGYGDISATGKVDFTLNETRSMTFGLKREGDIVAAYVNGEKHAELDLALSDGKTMSDIIDGFTDGKGYLQFGATLENDTDNVELSYTLTKTTGALDAFTVQEPVTDDEDTDFEPVVTAQGSGDSGGNYNYWILYGIGGCVGIAALVCYVASAVKRS